MIADLAVNHLEWQILRSGHTLERTRHDFGDDLFMSTFDRAGAAEPGIVFESHR